jgi:hypothetical protein
MTPPKPDSLPRRQSPAADRPGPAQAPESGRPQNLGLAPRHFPNHEAGVVSSARRRRHETAPPHQARADAEGCHSPPCRRQTGSLSRAFVPGRTGAARAGRRGPRHAQAWVSVSAASIVVAFSGAVRLGGLRSRACRCSRGHRPSECDTEARDRRATLPQRHQRGVGGSLTRTPLRRAYRLQRPCSLPIVRAYSGSA